MCDGGGVICVYVCYDGLLWLFKMFYFEGVGVVYVVFVYLFGGLVGGDWFDIQFDVQVGVYLFVIMLVVMWFYCFNVGEVVQVVQVNVGEGVCLEWLLQEILVYLGCFVCNEVWLSFVWGVSLFVIEVLGLGLLVVGQVFEVGWLLQYLEIIGLWLDCGWLVVEDQVLFDGFCGFVGCCVLGMLVYVQIGSLVSIEVLLVDSCVLFDGELLFGVIQLLGLGCVLLLVCVFGDEVEVVMLVLWCVWVLWWEWLWGLFGSDLCIWVI